MDPATILGLTNAALTLIEQGLPIIQSAVQSGEITPDQQIALLARYNSLKAAADGQFSGPEWKIDP